jgi:O-antigen ligase
VTLARHTGPRLADVIVFGLFLAVPLAASPGFWDQFTTVKWYTLEALAAAWFLTEVWWCGSSGWPAFIRERWPACLLLGVLVLLGSLRSGVAWAGPALLDRLSFVLLALASYWYFRRNEGWTGSITLASSAATGLVVAVGLAQIFGWRPLPCLTAGDQRSAFFGNVNMTAQFLGFAVIFLLAGSGGHGRALANLRGALATVTFVYLYFLSCRSVFLALGGALVVLLAVGRLRAASLARMIGAAAVAILLLLHYEPLLHLLSPEVMAQKALSTEMRLAVWRSTLGLIRDHPLGVGSGNFGDAFIPYQLGLEMIPGETIIFRAPHNEYLRTLAEEGLPGAAVAAVLLFSLLRKLHLGPRTARWRSGPGALLGAGIVFFAAEAFFQFPLGTAFGCLMAAVLLGLALAGLDPPVSSTDEAGPGRGSRGRWRGLGMLVAATVLVLLGRVVASELLFVHHADEAAAQEAACRLNPRNLPACVTAAWLRARAGGRREARALLVQTLRRSPYYHPAIRLLGEEAAANGDLPGACHYLWIYDELFRERSAVHSRLGASCGNAPPAGVPPWVTMPYYGKLPLAESDAALFE